MTLLYRMLIGVLSMLLTACTPLMRGVEGGKLLSGGRPPLTVGCALPLKAAGWAAPFIMTDLGFKAPDTWLTVYGAEDAASPLAVAVFSEAPELMEWHYPSFSPSDGPITGEDELGGRVFASSVRITDAAGDPFTPLLGLDEDAAASLRWLSQRYTAMAEFRKSKIILEYREPLPEGLDELPTVMFFADERVKAFSWRARQAFEVHFACAEPPDRRAEPIQGLNQRTLGAFVGSLGRKEPWFFERD